MLSRLEPSAAASNPFLIGPGQRLTPMYGEGFSFSSYLPALKKLGEAIIKNPDVQKTAMDIGKSAFSDIMSKISQARARQAGSGIKNSNNKKKKNLNPESRRKLESLLKGGALNQKGGCLRIIQ